jgi:hypothetical protein
MPHVAFLAVPAHGHVNRTHHTDGDQNLEFRGGGLVR